MARGKTGYIPKGYLNSAASTTSAGSTDAESGLPIQGGLTLGLYQEFTDSEALRYSNGQVVAVNILTAGSGQTNGTYTATASSGGATISYVISGGALTSVTITSGGNNGQTTTPTFTIAAGGTAGTVQAVLGNLYSGIYQWVQLDPAVTGTIAPGTPLFWLQTATGYVVTTVDSGNSPDFAGVSIDPNFGASNPYAFIQANGKTTCLMAASGTVPTTIGDVVQITSASANTFNAVAAGNAAAAWNGLCVGRALGAIPVSSAGLVRIDRFPTRF